MDQAQRLREIVAGLESGDQPVSGAGFFAQQQARLPRMITVTACGAVADFAGLAANLAVGLAKFAPPVVVVAAGGAQPLCRLMGGAPRRLLPGPAGRRADLSGAVTSGPAGVNLMLIDHAFLQDMHTLDATQLEPLVEPLSRLKHAAHLVLVVLPPGLTLAALNFLVAAQSLAVCTAGDAEAAKQSYLLIKIVSRQNPGCPLALLAAGERAANRSIIGTAARFLHCTVTDLGSLAPDDWQDRGWYAAEHPGSTLGKTIDLIAEKLYTNLRPACAPGA
jgi:hypothetical protein